jgi:site-specific DNA-methyltransferase (adenine-specific)
MGRAAERPFARIPLGRGRSVVLWNEDAVARLPDRVRRADVVVTSPPYNRGVRYARYADARPRGEYLAWMGALGESVARVLAPEGSFFLNVGASPSDPWLPWDVARAAGRPFVLQNVIHWVKSIAIDRRAAGRSAGLDRDLALGHYKPLVSDRYLHGAHEYVFHFTRTGSVRIDRLAVGIAYQDKSNVARWGRSARDVRCRGNTWFLPYATIRSRDRDRPHPAPFPVELPQWCIRLHGTDRTRLVVDPFVGIGASAVAAARLGVGFVGFDLDPGYLRTAAQRVRDELAVRPAAASVPAPRTIRPPRSGPRTGNPARTTSSSGYA